MIKRLTITAGSSSSAGRKPANQDCHGFLSPENLLCATKGIVAAVADGISTSNVSHIASQTAINSFVSDYYCTPEAWSVKKSAHKVLKATNSWLYAQTQNSPHRFNKDKGYICTFSGVIFKSNTAHIFHSGDSRIYRLQDGDFEQLTQDHRRQVSTETSYLTRALGIHQQLELDYASLPLVEQDIFLLATDGIYEYCGEGFLKQILSQCLEKDADLDQLCQSALNRALESGGTDNLTLQILRIDTLPEQKIEEVQQQVSSLALPPELAPRMKFDGYTLQRELYISSRSHVYLATDDTSQRQVVLKVPSTELRGNQNYLESMLLEEWIARRIDNPHVLKAYSAPRKKHYLYLATEFIEGQSLGQWMIDNPKPSLAQVRDIISQIGKGLQAFHRQEMMHQDLRPNNIMVDGAGVVKIIDFGATRVAGISDIGQVESVYEIPGTAQFSAPEYFTGEPVDSRSDIFSLAVICYQMLTGRLPYGLSVANARTRKEQAKLSYQPIHPDNAKKGTNAVPEWVEMAIQKALKVEPRKRYYEVSEFIYDLHNPSPEFQHLHRPPLIERDPVKFWQCISLVLFTLLMFEMVSG
ncbi:bifunctional protein-serine/threonine kinase/phosphatase [Parendozoicomonas sp. Alg238-R29]|uniref:bifunctional protein-serine/threonine kinase/phosphatase n=1 Tax=Parendozoicomonas sp. Alg238-R29 TaxID=2993446 RepID=UPI00248E1301|nr:bifunctional protein-serine/threonine kinase/phosphatase [Parendozoicomonas sp. Alg238-R29]